MPPQKASHDGTYTGLSVREVAEVMRVAPWTVYGWVAEKFNAPPGVSWRKDARTGRWKFKVNPDAVPEPEITVDVLEVERLRTENTALKAHVRSLERALHEAIGDLKRR